MKKTTQPPEGAIQRFREKFLEPTVEKFKDGSGRVQIPNPLFIKNNKEVEAFISDELKAERTATEKKVLETLNINRIDYDYACQMKAQKDNYKLPVMGKGEV